MTPLLAPAPTPLEWVTVSTTAPASPFPPASSRGEIRTARLVLRQTQASDLGAWHAMRSQPEVMKWTSQGVVDRDEAMSRDVLARRLGSAADDRFDFAICLADDPSHLIGVGGSHIPRAGDLGWPVVGYMLRRECWGRGYATEFLDAFLAAWWALPRVAVADLPVDRSTVDAARAEARECIVAVTLDDNTGSRRVLEKCGFELVKAWEEADLRDPQQTATLCGYVARRPSD